MMRSLMMRPGNAGTPAVVVGPGFPKFIAAALTAARQRPSDHPHLVTTTTHGSPPFAKATLRQPATISAPQALARRATLYTTRLQIVPVAFDQIKCIRERTHNEGNI